MWFSILTILDLFAITCSFNTKFIHNNSNTSLAEYIYFVYNFYANDYDGYLGIVDNVYDKKYLNYFLQYIHHKEQNSVVCVSFNTNDGGSNENRENAFSNRYMGHLTLLYIFINTSEDLPLVLNMMQNLSIYQTRCRMIAVVHNVPSKTNLQNVFKEVFSRYILNIIIVFERHNSLQVYTYNPFWDKEYFLEDFSSYPREKDVFYDKLKNLNGYPITLLILKDDDLTKVRVQEDIKTRQLTYGGTDVILVRHLVRKLNGTLHIINSADFLKPGERNPWRQTNEIGLNLAATKKRIIIQEHVDLLNSEEMVLNKELSDATENLYPHDKDDLMIIMLKGEKVPFYRYLFMVFTLNSWLAFISAFVAIVSFRFIFIRISKNLWVISVINLFRITTAGSLPILPKRNSERIFIIFWIIYCFITGTAFQSILTSILMQVKHFPDFQTLQELDESGLKVRAFGTIINEVKKSFTGTAKSSLINKLIPMPNTFDHANNSQNNFYSLSIFLQPTVLNYNRASFYTRVQKFYSEGRSLLHVIRESILPRYLAFQVPVRSPLLNRLNYMLRRIQESGLLIAWRKVIDHHDVIHNILVPDDYCGKNGEQLLHTLSILHLQTAFFILGIGLLLAGIVFISEIWKFQIQLDIFRTFGIKAVCQYRQ